MVDFKAGGEETFDDLKKTLLVTVADDLKRRKIPEKAKLFLYKDALKPGQVIFCDNAAIKLDRPSLLVFVDHAPLLNWGHQCEYFLFNRKDTVLYQVISASMPPKGFFLNPTMFLSLNKPSPPPVSPEVQPQDAGSTGGGGTGVLKQMIDLVPGNRYAILISGMSEERHLNDLEYLYHTLTTRYSFAPENVRVLNLNGKCEFCTNPGSSNASGTPDPAYRGGYQSYKLTIDGPATRQNIMTSFRSPGWKPGPAGSTPWNLGDKDLLFVFVTNHGLYDGDAYIVCDDNVPDDFGKYDTIGVPDFSQALAAAPQVHALVVLMEQCFGGAFQNAVLGHGKARYKYFAAACGPCNSSVALDDRGLFDQFAYNMTMALSGRKPDDSPGDVYFGDGPTLRSVYDYALSKVQSVYDHGVSYVDTPVSAELPKDAGKTMTLKGV
jgi:hypothetical protein